MQVETTHIRTIRAAGVAGLVCAALATTSRGLVILLLGTAADAWADS
jgi:hypothetical protein